jgi:hypothetical protein
VVRFADGCLGMFSNGECVYFDDLENFKINELELHRHQHRLDIRLNKWPSLCCLKLMDNK